MFEMNIAILATGDFMFPNSIDFRDLKILSELSNQSSLRSLASYLDLEPQNLSKIIKSIEQKLNTEIIHRSSKGISITEDGMKYSQMADTILNLKPDLSFIDKKESRTITIASRVFINTCLAPALTNNLKNFRFRFVDGSPTKKEIWARSGLVDLVISLGELDLGKKFISEKMGVLEWGFFTNINNEMPDVIHLSQAKNYKIIGSSYIELEKLREVFSFDHQNKHKLNFSHCAETSITSMMIASTNKDLVYLPKILIKTMKFENQFKEIKIKDITLRPNDVFLSCQIDKIKKKEYNLMSKILSEFIS